MTFCATKSVVKSSTLPNFARGAARLPIVPFVIPAGVFGLRSVLQGFCFGLNGRSFGRMFSPRPVQHRLRLIDRILPACTLLCLAASSFARWRSRRSCSFSKATVAFRSAALSSRREESFFALWLDDLRPDFAGLSPSPRLVGSAACSPKDPPDSTGRLRMTPGFAMVALMTSGSSLSFATP